MKSFGEFLGEAFGTKRAVRDRNLRSVRYDDWKPHLRCKDCKHWDKFDRFDTGDESKKALPTCPKCFGTRIEKGD